MSEKQLLNAEDTWRTVQAMIDLYPQDRSELNFDNAFQAVIAVLLSAQTTDDGVNKVTPELFEKYPTPEKLSRANQDELIEIIRPIGLYRNKSKSLINMSKMLVDEFDAEVPNDRKDLERLPGVGRKTASVVLSAYFGIPAFAVDTHIERITKKFHMVPEDATVRQVEDIMVEKLPKEHWYQSHHSILLFGRYQCVARQHDHEECIRLVKDHLPK